jgi:hypothetical protein
LPYFNGGNEANRLRTADASTAEGSQGREAWKSTSSDVTNGLKKVSVFAGKRFYGVFYGFSTLLFKVAIQPCEAGQTAKKTE